MREIADVRIAFLQIHADVLHRQIDRVEILIANHERFPIELANLSIVEIHNLVGVPGQGIGIGRQEMPILADAQHHRTAQTSADDHARFMLGDHGQPIRSHDQGQCPPH